MIKTTKINRFDGGMLEDLRTPSSNGFAITKHFRIYRHKLKPYPELEAEEDKNQKLAKFVYAPYTSASTFRLFGLGVVTGTNRAAIYETDPVNADTDDWQASGADNYSDSGTRNTDVFFHYKNYLYNWDSGTRLQRYGDLTAGSGSHVFTEAYQTISYTNVAQPIHHSRDDIAYFFQDNIVHKLDNTTWTSSVLTLPSNLRIVSACEYGNFLAIGCTPLVTASSVEPVVFLWDRDSSITTLADKISLGFGKLLYIANLDGQLIAVIDRFTNNFIGAKTPSLVIKNLITKQKKEIKLDSADSDFFEHQSFVKNDKLYFPANIQWANGTTYEGIWEVDAGLNLTLAISINPTSNSFQGIYATGGMWWIAHSGDGSVERTATASIGYTDTSVYESQIFSNDGDTLELQKVRVMTEPIPSGGILTLKYRTDVNINGGSWTTIFAHSTANSLRHTAVNIESTGAVFGQYKEIQFRIESYQGVSITGLKFIEKIIDDDI